MSPATTAIPVNRRSWLSTDRPAGWTATVMRIAFGVVWGIDAYLKWLPGYRDTYIAQLRTAARGQPPFLHGWFHFWISLQSSAPQLFADLTGVTETALAIVLLFGVARRAGYLVGAGYMFLVWGVGEGFGGPYMSGSTDIGTGIIYTLLFATLLVFAPPARRERLSLDRLLAARWRWWRHVAEPHGADRRAGRVTAPSAPARPAVAPPVGASASR
jgi:thiosulfate dehydrogenase (quinone) large subunit